MIRFTKKIAVLAMLCLSTQAFAVNYYITETDSNGLVYIIDTDNGTFVSKNVSPQLMPGAIAISGNRIVMANYPDDGSWEYDLDFNPTGNSYPGSNTWDEMLDGTTDGSSNYSVNWSTGNIIQLDQNFENGSILFTAPFSVIGITYDPTNDSFWLVSDDDTSVYNFTRAGVEISHWDAAINNRDCCLAYDEGTDTLWLSANGQDVIYNFDKSGTLLNTVPIPGLNASNTWGGEISITNNTQPGFSSIAIPTLSSVAIFLMLLMISGLAVFRLKQS